jgi:hypothetical protein
MIIASIVFYSALAIKHEFITLSADGKPQEMGTTPKGI